MPSQFRTPISRQWTTSSILALALFGISALLTLSACASTSFSTGKASIVLRATATQTIGVFPRTPTATIRVFQIHATPTTRAIKPTATATIRVFQITATPTTHTIKPTATATIPVFQITPTATPAPQPPTPSTYSETAGSYGSGTFTDYTNAGGTLGQRVAAYQTIQVSCRLTGWTAPDGNNWWYRVASSPWNNAFYTPADNFYNNGQTSGSLNGTPLVDTQVPLC